MPITFFNEICTRCALHSVLHNHPPSSFGMFIAPIMTSCILRVHAGINAGLSAGHLCMMAAASPSCELSPIEVVDSQLAALQKGDVQTCFAFASPANKRATGPWQRFELMVRQTPAYAPLVGCTRYAVVGALPTGDQGYRCRVRVWPVGGDRQFAVATPVIDYDWLLTRQPEDAAEHSGCWMVDGVMPDDAWERARARGI